jgi:hypothetical protein
VRPDRSRGHRLTRGATSERTGHQRLGSAVTSRTAALGWDRSNASRARVHNLRSLFLASRRPLEVKKPRHTFSMLWRDGHSVRGLGEVLTAEALQPVSREGGGGSLSGRAPHNRATPDLTGCRVVRVTGPRGIPPSPVGSRSPRRTAGCTVVAQHCAAGSRTNLPTLGAASLSMSGRRPKQAVTARRACAPIGLESNRRRRLRALGATRIG